MATTRTFAALVAEELPLQSAAVDMEGGTMPSCLKLFDRYLSCYCASASSSSNTIAEFDGWGVVHSSPQQPDLTLPKRHHARLPAQVPRFQVLSRVEKSELV